MSLRLVTTFVIVTELVHVVHVYLLHVHVHACTCIGVDLPIHQLLKHSLWKKRERRGREREREGEREVSE